MRKTFRFHLQALIDEFKPDLIIFNTYSIKLVDIILTIRTNAYKIIESHVACYTIKKSYDIIKKDKGSFKILGGLV